MEDNVLTIKILGSGCANCKRVEQIARTVAQNLDIQAEFIKVTDYDEILSYDILATPGLVINEEVVCTGRIPTQVEVDSWITRAIAKAYP
jgi:small redox-active disulfide protein 2